MEHRHLGRSGLTVSEIAYGNWITHGSQVEEDAALACVTAALDEGITTYDTADAYARTRAEEVLGKALHGVRREKLEICTKVFWPTGSGANDRGLSRKHIIVSEWRAEEIAAALRIADQLGLDRIISNQPQYNMLWRVIESEVVELSQKEGIGQIVWSPIAQGVLTGKYLPGAAAPAGSRATDQQGSGFISRLLTDEILTRVQLLKPVADQVDLTLAQLAVAWTLQNANVSAAIVGATRPEQVRENVKASGVRLDADLMSRIDEALSDVVVRDPALTESPRARP